MSPFSPKNSLVQKNTKPKGSLFQILGPVTLPEADSLRH